MKVHWPLSRFVLRWPTSLDLSTGNKCAVDQMMGSTGDEATDGPTGIMDEDAWFDVDMGGPLDTEVQLSGEGGETEHLSEYLGQ